MADIKKIIENYGVKDIKTLEGIEAIRLRPGMYIGSTGPEGVKQITLEIISNAIDEYLNGYCTSCSIYVGEDGPTRQPIETLASLRCIPHVQVLRPGDAEETQLAWEMAMESKDHPVCMAFTRQDLPVYAKGDKNWRENARTGAYVVLDCAGTPDALRMRELLSGIRRRRSRS